MNAVVFPLCSAGVVHLEICEIGCGVAGDAVPDTAGRQRWGRRLRQEYLESCELRCSKREVLSRVKLKLTALPVWVGREEPRGETRRVQQRPEAAAAVVQGRCLHGWPVAGAR